MSEVMLLKYGLIVFLIVSTLFIAINYLIKARLGAMSLYLLASIIFLGLTFAYCYVIEPNWIEVKKVRIKDPELARVLGKTKIVHISDLHLNEGITYRERKLIHKVNRINPDLIFISGDFIDDLSQLKAATELLQSLSANVGIYGVPGNTDHLVMDSLSLRRELAPAGINLLINESEPIALPNGNTLWVLGLDDAKYGYENIKRAMENFPAKATSIMISHSPDIIKHSDVSRVNLILAGDTHGGQIGILPLVRMSEYANRTKYMKGLFKENGTQMYVNRGIGMKTLPIRFLCRPEISIIEAKK